MLTDRMKSVLLEMDGRTPVWNPRFAEFMAAIGVVPRVCQPYTPQTKGKVERSIRVVKDSFWPGIQFADLDDLNRQARAWCDARNRRVQRTTGRWPVVRWTDEHLAPLPSAFAWERFATEDRKVSWDGDVSYDGVQYGVPAEPPVAGTVVQVRERQGTVRIWRQGQLLLAVTKRPRSRECVPHPDQFRTVLPAAAWQRVTEPLAHQVSTVVVARRTLADYDQLWQHGGG